MREADDGDGPSPTALCSLRGEAGRPPRCEVTAVHREGKRARSQTGIERYGPNFSGRGLAGCIEVAPDDSAEQGARQLGRPSPVRPPAPGNL